jgi:hypothetical protein
VRVQKVKTRWHGYNFITVVQYTSQREGRGGEGVRASYHFTEGKCYALQSGSSLHGVGSHRFSAPHSLRRTMADKNSKKQHCNNESNSFITFKSTVSLRVRLTTMC